MKRKTPILPLELLVLARDEPDVLLDMAEVAQATGFERLWVADERFFRDCWAILGMIGARVPGLNLGVCVTDPFVRHPALTAVAAATVDEITGGRFTLGLGAGISGFTAMAIEKRKPLTAMREAVGLIRALLEGRRVDLDGDVVVFHDSALDFTPRPGIPIMIATNGPRMLELAGELADQVMVQGMATAAMVERVRHHIEIGLRRAGRHPRAIKLTARLDVAVSDSSPEEARSVMLPGLVRHLVTHHPRYASFELAGIQVPPRLSELVSQTQYRHAGQDDLARQIPEDWIDHFCLAGSRSHVRSRLEELKKAGVDAVAAVPMALSKSGFEEVALSFAQAAGAA